MNFKKLRKYNGRKAVSPVVATLILIIVAIVGAVAVGLIVSGIGSQTSKSSNVGGAAQGATTQLVVGGSATMYPSLVAAAASFDQAHPGINVNVTRGGSGAGMTGVALGVIDVGASGSYTSVVSAISEFPSANLQAAEVGGSAVVIITNGGAGGFLSDGTNKCVEITQADLNTIYSATTDASGYFTIGTGGCTGGILAQADITADVASTATGAIQVVSRSDLPSGAEDTLYDYAFSSTTSNIATPLPGATEAGDTGILSYVQAHTDTLGFVDLGFAEGQTAAAAQGVSILQVNTPTAGVAPVACTAGSEEDGLTTTAPTTGADCYVLDGQSTAPLHAFVGTSLSTSAPSASKPIYPDITSGTGVAAFGLTRTFWLVTAGAPDSNAQQFINFVQSPANQGFWNNEGFFSVYQLTPIAAP